MSNRVSLNDKTSKTVNELINVNNDTNKDVNNDTDINKDTPVIQNRFVLEVKKKEEIDLKRATYYLKPDIIKQIEKIAKKTNMGKSELVQKILEEALSNIEIK